MKTAYLLEKMAFLLLLSIGIALQGAANASSVELIESVSIVERKQLNADYLQLTIALGNRRETLILSENPAFQDLEIFDQHGQPAAGSTKTYKGTVANLANSWVRVAITEQELDGVIDTGTQRLFFTSKPASSEHRRTLQRGTPVDKITAAPDKQRTVSEVVEIPIGDGFGGAADGVTRVARIAIVVDSFYDEALGGRGLSEAISTINTVDGLYQQEFGLSLKVDTAIIITDSETLDLKPVSLEDNLARFRTYRLNAAELAPDLALAHLFTGVQTEDSSVGLAYIDSACREDGYDVSLSTPFQFPVLLTAHEIGHNLGATHDDETALCKLSDELLMHSQISDKTTNQFSACSRNAVVDHLNKGACFFAAIDLALTLTRDEETGVIAIITNTDPDRAVPSAELSIQLKHASIASAPASCNISNTTEVSCIIPTTLAGESQSLNFSFRYDDSQENTIDATLEAIGFVDTKTINNYAQIILPATIDDNDTITIAGNDSDAPAETGAGNNSAVGSAGGGGQFDGYLFLLSLLVLFRRMSFRCCRAVNGHKEYW